MNGWRNPGVIAAIGAALLFGAGTPAAKLLLGPVSPWLLAGLLYLGSGAGLALWRALRRSAAVRLPHGEAKWLAAAILAGGVAAPVLLMWGLARAASTAPSCSMPKALTALLDWFVFAEIRRRSRSHGFIFRRARPVLAGETPSTRAFPSPRAARMLFWARQHLHEQGRARRRPRIAMLKGLAAGRGMF